MGTIQTTIPKTPAPPVAPVAPPGDTDTWGRNRKSLYSEGDTIACADSLPAESPTQKTLARRALVWYAWGVVIVLAFPLTLYAVFTLGGLILLAGCVLLGLAHIEAKAAVMCLIGLGLALFVVLALYSFGDMSVSRISRCPMPRVVNVAQGSARCAD